MTKAETNTVAASERPDDRYRAVRKVTLIGSVLDVVLGVVKIVAGWAAHSQALIADGIHSLSDLATNFLVIFAAKQAHRGADAEHPYGHGRIETAATVGLGTALIAVGTGIGYDAIYRLFHPELLLHPGAWALVVAAISVGSKEWIYHYTMRLARRLRSNMLRANAWHSRSDAISSIVVMVGVTGAMAGLPYVDAIAAVGVAGMIAKIGWNLAWSSVRELIDTGVEDKELEDIRKSILAVDGVHALHLLRTRRMAGKVLVDVHILLSDPQISVSEGHQISEAVLGRLVKTIDDVTDVTVHIDPEDDEVASPNRQLPLRTELLARLNRCWESIEASRHIKGVNLHYLNGRIHVEVLLPLSLACNAANVEALADAFAAAVSDDPDIGDIRVLYA